MSFRERLYFKTAKPDGALFVILAESGGALPHVEQNDVSAERLYFKIEGETKNLKRKDPSVTAFHQDDGGGFVRHSE